MSTKCPMCGSEDQTAFTKPPYKEPPAHTTEVHGCIDCPCVWFEFHDQQDWINLGDALGLHQAE